MKKNNNLRIDKISLAEAGDYYCWQDEGSQDHATDDKIISRIDLIVVALIDAKYVSKLKTPDYSEKSLIYPSSWRNKKLKWEIGDPLECSDCGHQPGDIRQYAACYFKNSAGDLQPCDHRYMMNQVMVQKCHIPCRPKIHQEAPDTFKTSLEEGIPDLPTWNWVSKKFEVLRPGNGTALECFDHEKRSLFNLPVAWRFTNSKNETKAILRSFYVNATENGQDSNVFINLKDQLIIKHATPENTGQYKCYINYELRTYHHIEVLSPKLTFIQEIMVYVLMGGLGIIVLVLMFSFVYPYFRPYKKGTMPSNLGLVQQRCVKKIMEHVDAKTTNKDIDDPDEYDEMMEIKKNVLKYVKGFDSFATQKPKYKSEESIPLLKDTSSHST